MKLVQDYFYSICGYREGWCDKRSKCKFKVNFMETSHKMATEISLCNYFLDKHPRTGENYDQFARNWK